MSGYISETTCPNCGNKEAQFAAETRPYDWSGTWCHQCGFVAETQQRYLNLGQLNEYRKERYEMIEEDIWTEEFAGRPLNEEELKDNEDILKRLATLGPLKELPEQNEF